MVSSTPIPARAAPPPSTENSIDTVQLPRGCKAKLKEPLPREAVSPNPQKPGLSVIKVIYVVERLNDVFGLNGWHVDNEVVETGRMVVVRATLSIPRYAIAIEQFGGNDNPDRGDAYKGACTDALSKCASYLGIGMDVYKGLYERREIAALVGRTARGPEHQTPAPRATSTQNGAHSNGASPTGLTSRNMAARFSSMRTVLGAREYSDILGRHGFREVTGIPSLEKAREVYRVLLDAFRARFGEAKKGFEQPRVREHLAGAALEPEGEAESRPGGAGLQSHGGNSQCQTVMTGPERLWPRSRMPTELARDAHAVSNRREPGAVGRISRRGRSDPGDRRGTDRISGGSGRETRPGGGVHPFLRSDGRTGEGGSEAPPGPAEAL